MNGLTEFAQRHQALATAWAAPDLYRWWRAGKPPPPPHVVKQMVLRRYAKRFDLKVLVETGTYLGDMVAAMIGQFARIYSIELGVDLRQHAVERFRGRPDVELILGDSAVELGRLVPMLGQPALFWLDGHYSAGVTARAAADTPILEELAHIMGSGEARHVVIIDDARAFGTDPAYPTLEDVAALVRERSSGADVSVGNDSIRIVPGPGRPGLVVPSSVADGGGQPDQTAPQ